MNGLKLIGPLVRAMAVLAGGLILVVPPRVVQAVGCGTASFGTATDFGVGAAPLLRSGRGLQRRRDARPGRGECRLQRCVDPAGHRHRQLRSGHEFRGGNLPVSVAVGDFNGDGKLDLAVANGELRQRVDPAGHRHRQLRGGHEFRCGDCSLSPWQWGTSTATGSSTSPWRMPAPTMCRSCWAPAPAASGRPRISLWALVLSPWRSGTSTATASSTSPWRIPAPTMCRSCWAPAPAASRRPRISPSGLVLVSVAVGDFNGDGKLDLAVANANSNNVSILLGTGTGSFAAATNFAAGTDPLSVAVGDFNGDGKLDLAVANDDADHVSILLGTGTGSFGAATNFGVGTEPHSVAVGDFNGDGTLDLALASLTSSTCRSCWTPASTCAQLRGGRIRVGRFRSPWRSGTSTATANSTSPWPTRLRQCVDPDQWLQPSDADSNRHDANANVLR